MNRKRLRDLGITIGKYPTGKYNAITDVAGVAVGGFIGWWLDRFLGTAPLLMVAFLGLGAAAGIMNVVRTAKRMQAEAQSVKDLPSVLDDDDD